MLKDQCSPSLETHKCIFCPHQDGWKLTPATAQLCEQEYLNKSPRCQNTAVALLAEYRLKVLNKRGIPGKQ